MSCNNSICLDQLLEPDPDDDFLILNSNNSPSTFEAGVVAIPDAATRVDVTFATPKLSDQYNFNAFSLENTVDPTPLAIVMTLVSRTRTGFAVTLSPATDSANYQLRFSIVVVGT